MTMLIMSASPGLALSGLSSTGSTETSLLTAHSSGSCPSVLGCLRSEKIAASVETKISSVPYWVTSFPSRHGSKLSQNISCLFSPSELLLFRLCLGYILHQLLELCIIINKFYLFFHSDQQAPWGTHKRQKSLLNILWNFLSWGTQSVEEMGGKYSKQPFKITYGRNPVWWLNPSIPALGRQKQAHLSLWVGGQPGPRSKFLNSQK